MRTLAVAVALFSTAVFSQTEGGDEPASPQTYPYIFIATADGSNVRPLIKGLGPAWSSYGERLAFFREGSSFREGTLFVIDEDGRYGFEVQSGTEPAWSPNGEELVYTGTEGIVRGEPQNALQRTLIRHDFLLGVPYSEGGTDPLSDMGVGKAAWSPDGSWIAFEHLGDGEMTPAQIYLMDAAGGNVQLLSPPGGIRYAESDPAWSPDGSSIAFWSYGHGLAVMRLADRSVRTVYKDFPWISYGTSPAWSPDGSAIAFVVRHWDSSTRSIWLVDSAGGAPQEFITDAYDPAWSPDGNYIAFVSDLRGPEPERVFPAVPDALAVYTRESPHLFPLDAQSRYVLFADSSFELQYLLHNGESLSYSGDFARTGSEVTFDFDNWYTTWQSFGSLSEDESTLRVRYDDYMMMSDFEDGVYRLGVESPEGATGPEDPADPDGPIKEPDEPRDPPVLPPLAPACLSACPPDDDESRQRVRLRN